MRRLLESAALRSPIALPGAALLCLAALAYHRAVSVPFYLDDVAKIVIDPTVHVDAWTVEAFRRILAARRPLATLTFALDYRLHGLDVFGYHAVNVALHAVNGVLVFALARSILEIATGDPPETNRRRAFVTSLVFVAHPVHTQAVTYVVQRMTVLGAGFAFLATLLWLRARTQPSRRVLFGGAAVAAFGAALLAKEAFLLLPAVLLATDGILFPGLGRRLRAHAAGFAAALATFGAVAAFAALRFAPVIAAEHGRFGLTFAERLLTQARVTLHYASLLALPLPSRLRLDMAFPASTSLLDPLSTLAAVLALGAAIAGAVLLRRRAPVLSFAVVWFLGNLVLEAVMPLDPVFEHRLYFPSFGPILAVAHGLDRLVERARIAPVVAWAPLVLLLAVGTDLRNRMWADPVELLSTGARDGTAHPRALVALANALYERGRLTEAEPLFRRAIAAGAIQDPRRGFVVMPRDLANAWNGLGLVRRASRDLAGAEAAFRRALALDAATPSARLNLGSVLFDAERLGEAEHELRGAAADGTTAADALTLLGLIRARAGDVAGARGLYGDALRADPRAWAAWWSRARLLYDAGRPAEAVPDLERVVELRPRDAQALAELGACLQAAGRPAEAARRYEATLALDPSNPLARERLATLRAGR